MNQDTLVEHLFRYTLEKVCKGNRNEFARRADIHPVEVRRLIRRYNEGGGSGVAGEALLRMYSQDPDLSLDKALDEISKTLVPQTADFSQTPCAFYAMLNEIESAYIGEYLLLQEKSDEIELEAKAYKHADDFMKKLRKLFCDRKNVDGSKCGNCSFASNSSECPCVKFSQYFEWLRMTLTAKRSS